MDKSISNLKTQSAQVAHNVNVQMIQLRQLEVNYFSQFYTSFGVQSAFIGSMAMSCMAQTPGLGADAFYAYVYWLGNALSSIGGLFALVLSLVVIVYGQALALRGPPGSMAKAVDGMIDAQNQIVSAFSFSFVFLSFMMCGIYLIMMDLPAAILCSFISIAGLIVTRTYCDRIYNRFSYTPDVESLNDNIDLDSDEPGGDAIPTQPSALGAAGLRESLLVRSGRNVKPNGTFGAFSRNTSRSITQKLSRWFGNRDGQPSLNERSRISLSNSGKGYSYVPPSEYPSSNGISMTTTTQKAEVDERGHLVSSSEGIEDRKDIKSGYLAIQESSVLSTSWARRYVVLKGSYMVYYNNKMEFDTKPQNSINKRAINFAGFEVNVEITDASYRILLSPGDNEETSKAWEFRCDTESEFQSWSVAFRRASQRQRLL